MNIKELVPVISILLSIRIAEYAMKKYKEQKDVEVTKKQKSRKQTKKYIITAPSILKVGLPCGIFFGCTTIAFILSQIFKWEFVQQIENCYFMLICLLVSIGFTVLGIVLTLYGNVNVMDGFWQLVTENRADSIDCVRRILVPQL